MDDFKVLSQEDVGALASPFRRELLNALSTPDSAVNLARRFDMSRQRIGYHMRELEKAGCIEVAEERQQRGLMERLYRVRPLAYVFAPPEQMTPAERQDRYSWATLVNLAARTLWDLVSLRKRADAANKRLATLGIEAEVRFASPQARKAFTEELVRSIDSLVQRYDEPQAPGARAHRFLVGAYPSPDSRRKTDA